MIVESPLPPVLISVASLADFYQSNLVGPANGIIEGPYGKTRYVYADWTASGQSLRSIEDQIQTQVLPYYANTHTEASHSGQQMTLYREQARAMVKTACHATDDDVCIFTGCGATGAIQKLIDILEIRLSPGEQSKAARDRLPDSARPIVLIGPWEHHSNLLAWRETSARVIEVPACPITGSFSYDSLSAILREISSHPQSSRTLLGSFSAASNVTGITLDIPRVSRVIHEFGGIAVFDCAAWASHLKPDMNPVKEDPAASPDAIFMSPHKLAGGPGCPGILLAKKRIIRNSIPGCVGGGVVELVTRRDSIWISDIETREEAGTPDIVGSIRCGLVFALKSLPVRGQDDRLERSHTRLHRAWARWSELDDLVWLGAPPGITHRVPIISFQIKGLDMGFVNTLLSDLFGIQARDGCFCAHPYIADLLNMTDFQSNAVRPLYIDRKIYRQGATRVSFPWFMSEEDVTYVIEAVAWISEFGWKFLPEYQIDLTTAKWTHRVHTRRVHMLSYSELFNVETRTPLQQDSCVPRPTLDDTIKKLERHLETSQSPISPLSLLKDEIPIGRLDQFRSFATPLEGALVRASAQSGSNRSSNAIAMAERAAWHDHLAVIAARNLPDNRAQTRETKVIKSPFVSKSTLDTVPILSKGPTGKRRSILGRLFKKQSETLLEPVTVGHAAIG